MQTRLLEAPAEFSEVAKFMQSVITLPMPDGSMQRFRIEHSPIVEPGLAAKYPELNQTYTGRGIDDPTATVRLDFLPDGFHSMVLSTKGTVMVDPYRKGDTDNYISYFKRDVPKTNSFACEFDRQNGIEKLFSIKGDAHRELIPDQASAEVVSGANLRTYRLALAATNEYAAAVGGNTIAGTLAAQVLVMNRVNGVYERDVALRMVVVANNNLIIYSADNTAACGGVACTSGNDPYTNNNGSTMLGQNQSNLDAVIGIANYDIGHVFSTGGGGVATLQSPCNSTKARGVTGLPNPVGDPFSIDFVAHEMGHQWGGRHTYNGSGGNCSAGQHGGSSAMEPGSGITVMAYAGICGNQDLANNSIDTFHVKSIEDIVTNSTQGSGSACGIGTPTGNTPPTVAVVGGPIFNIPKQTPFTLTATGSDANGDSLTYDWQEYDAGSQTPGIPNTDVDGARPIFRVYYPTSSPVRTFPSEQYIRNNANIPPAETSGFLTGEILPQIARTMNFQVIARDNKPNGGGVNTATATVVVSGNGPFAVTSPNTNTTWNAGASRTIEWATAGSNAAPMNVANVKISLSTDGGVTFPTVLAASTPNDGSHDITVPAAINSSQARIKIEAVGNIFFDMSDVNFTMSANAATNGFLGGRIVNAAGHGVKNIVVVLSGPAGGRAVTNSFGYFRFENVPFASGYTVTPRPRKGVTFSPSSTSVNHAADAMNLTFTSN